MRLRKTLPIYWRWTALVLPIAVMSGIGTDVLAKEATSAPASPAGVARDDDKAGQDFRAAATFLQANGDRERAAAMFAELAEEYPQAPSGRRARELAGLLAQMAREDRDWREPQDLAALSEQERIAYYVHHLRNVTSSQFSHPGASSVLLGDQSKQKAALQLKEMGEAAIPILIGLLEDRRPTRSVGFHRAHHPSGYIVLRYQDAAIEILNKLLPATFYRRSSSSAYLSNEREDIRKRVIENVKTWHRKATGKNALERKWVAAELDLGIYPTLELLRQLAAEPGQKEHVIRRLHALANEKPPMQLPQVSFLLCRLGDRSLLPQVHDAFRQGDYRNIRSVEFWDDFVAASNATDYAIRQLILYGTDEYRDELLKEVSGREQTQATIMSNLLDLANNRFGFTLPEEYDRVEFPLQMLVAMLDIKSDSGTFIAAQHFTRWCDRAAAAIQKFTGQDFGFKEEASLEEKDAAIEKMREWSKGRSNRSP